MINKKSISLLILICILVISISGASACDGDNVTISVADENTEIMNADIDDGNLELDDSDDVLSYQCSSSDSLIKLDEEDIAIAESPLPTTVDSMYMSENGVVSGGAKLISVNPWTTNAVLDYTIPDDVEEIKSALVIVNSYSGSGNADSYALHSDVTLTADSTVALGSEDLTFSGNQVNDPVVYVINDHTTKQYSDYQYIYNITNNISTLNAGSSLRIDVNNSRYGSYNFDGRIKMVALFLAYDDGDNDNITYWLDVGQSWTNSEKYESIATSSYGGKDDNLTLETIALSSNYAQEYCLNGNELSHPTEIYKGNYYINAYWNSENHNLTDYFNIGDDTEISYVADESGWGSYKTNILLLTAAEKELPKTIIDANDFVMTYKDGSKLAVRLIDSQNNPISNVIINVNNTLGVYKYRTDANGIANVPVSLKPGEYSFIIAYNGDAINSAANATVSVTVNKIKTILTAEDVTVPYKENKNCTIALTDIDGNPISGVTLSVYNGARTLKYRTGSDGIANVPISLKIGEYTFTTTFNGNNIYEASNTTNTVIVSKATVNMEGDNISVMYNDGSNMSVRLTDVNGNPISGLTVKFDNGVTAYRYRTDANGVASAPIKLKIGNYTLKISFAGNSIYEATNITRTLTVNKFVPNLNASDVSISYKNGNLTARLTGIDGNAIFGATIKFTNGASTYRYRTDSNGIATAPINVKPGEYNYTISYDGNSIYAATSTAATVTVNKADVVLTADDINMTFKDGTNYTAKLTDINGNAIAGVIVKLNNTVKVYKYKTDAEGRIHVPINLKLGEYAFTAFIEGSDVYNPCNVTSTVVITR